MSGAHRVAGHPGWRLARAAAVTAAAVFLAAVAVYERYQHILDSIRRDVASQVGGLLWDEREYGRRDWR